MERFRPKWQGWTNVGLWCLKLRAERWLDLEPETQPDLVAVAYTVVMGEVEVEVEAVVEVEVEVRGCLSAARVF